MKGYLQKRGTASKTFRLLYNIYLKQRKKEEKKKTHSTCYSRTHSIPIEIFYKNFLT